MFALPILPTCILPGGNDYIFLVIYTKSFKSRSLKNHPLPHFLCLVHWCLLLEGKGCSGNNSCEHNGFLGQYLYDTKLRQEKSNLCSIDPIQILVYTKRLLKSKLHFQKIKLFCICSLLWFCKYNMYF